MPAAQVRTDPAPGSPGARAWPAAVRIGIIAVFAVLLVAGLGLFSSATSPQRPAAPTAAAALVPFGDQDSNKVKDDIPLAQRYGATPGASMELLPAYRYSAQIGYLDTELSPTDELGGQLSSGLASGMFAVAAGVWQLLLMLMHYALTIDPLRSVGELVNKVFLALNNGIWKSGLAILALGLGVFAVTKKVLQGKGGILAAALAVLLPLAFMQTVAVAAGNDDKGTGGAVGSPMWLALRSSDQLTAVATGPTSLFGELSGLTGGVLSDPTQGGVSPTDCTAYFDQMYARFSEVRAGTTSTGAVNQGAAAAVTGGETGTLKLVSQMWYNAMYLPWQAAQFGSADYGRYPSDVSCHYLEMKRQSGTPEQFFIAGGTSVQANGDKWTGTIDQGPFTGFSTMPFAALRGVPGDQPNMYGVLFPWAACDRDGGQQMEAGWRALGGDQNPASNNGGGWVSIQQGIDACTSWRTGNAPMAGLSPAGERQGKEAFPQANNEGVLVPKDSGQVETMTDGTDANGRIKDAVKDENPDAKRLAQADLLNVRSLYRSFNGHNTGERLVAATVAVAGTIIYSITIAGLAIGTMVAQIGFALLIAILPVSLLLAAFSRNNQKGNPGVRLLKTTAAFAATKLGLVFLLTMFILLTSIIRSVVSVAAGGFAGQMIGLAAPLLAFFIMRTILKRAGFGSIMSPAGAMGMSASAAMRMSGENQAADRYDKAVSTGQDYGKHALAATAGLLAGGAAADRASKKKPDPGTDNTPAPGANEGTPPDRNTDPDALANPPITTPTNPDGTPATPDGITDPSDKGNRHNGARLAEAGLLGAAVLSSDGTKVLGPDGTILGTVAADGTTILGPSGTPIGTMVGGVPMLGGVGGASATATARASTSAIDQATRLAQASGVTPGSAIGGAEPSTVLGTIAAGLPAPDAQTTLGTVEKNYAEPADIGFDRLGRHGNLLPVAQAAAVGELMAAGALTAKGLTPDSTLTPATSDTQAAEVEAFARLKHLDDGQVLPSPFLETAPLANAARINDKGIAELPIAYDAQGNVDVEATLNSGGFTPLLSADQLRATSDVAREVTDKLHIEPDAAAYVTMLSAGRSIGVVDNSGNIANMVDVVGRDQLGEIKMVIEAAARNGDTHVHIPQLTAAAAAVGTIGIEEFTAAVKDMSTGFASPQRVSRDPIPNATAWAGQARAEVVYISEGARTLEKAVPAGLPDSGGDPPESTTSMANKFDEVLTLLNETLHALTASANSQAVTAVEGGGDGRRIAEDLRSEFAAMTDAVRAMAAGLQRSYDTHGTSTDPAAIARLNSDSNAALREISKIMERQEQAIVAAVKAAAASRDAQQPYSEEFVEGGTYT